MRPLRRSIPNGAMAILPRSSITHISRMRCGPRRKLSRRWSTAPKAWPPILRQGDRPAVDVDKYQILILGSGEAGKYLAWTMAKAGHRTAMVKRIVPEHCVPAQQEPDLFRKSSVAKPARRGIRTRNGFASD